ncbi:tetratricopeptide repeat protein [Xylophilus sp. GOD-11R]|uniref:O-linked N-acetylglucosamine transferase, SPINDLY family protein n=1 Tax=Xylophilus sp. GOD-11R TaxID=3089814 RepID=UPI00298BD812|nr:tetratricopeptide repeat protein [Xylophilus sp. GOD-11R]WPB57759.1 tetratricopeptide repeat protein [Xylophilus sp. GOD-11R]
MKKRPTYAPARPVKQQPATRPIAPEAREALERGAAFERRQMLKEALVQYMQALSFEPKLVHAWLRVAYIFLVGLHWQRGMEALETVLQLEPDSPDALRFLAFAEFNLGRLEEARRHIDRAARLSNESPTWVLRAFIHSNIDKDPVNTLKVYREWGSRVADPLTDRAAPLVVADRSPRRKLRVGYVTADFRRHSIAFFMLPVLQHHDPDEVEVHVFSSGGIDDITLQMQKLVQAWHNVTELDYEPLCEYIRAQRIDVLVDLSGHTLGERLLTFARRAAPVQVTWLGFMNTLGMRAMDWRLTDFGTSPAGTDGHYSETLFRLNVMASYSPPPDSPLLETPPMLHNGHPTLISLNNSAKLTDEMLRLWRRILERRTDARLVIMVKEHTPEDAQDAMQHRVEAAGMPIDRVFVMHQQPLERFMELGHIADVALDTSPISGGTTTLHAIWMGLPVVCMDAERATDSSTARTIQGLGFGGVIGADPDDYVEKALALMDDVEGLAEYRRTARDKFRVSVLMDYATRTAELERAYRLMWLNYLAGEKRWRDVTVDLEQAMREVEGLACEQS